MCIPARRWSCIAAVSPLRYCLYNNPENAHNYSRPVLPYAKRKHRASGCDDLMYDCKNQAKTKQRYAKLAE
jgi:hypothetical protein